MLQILMFSVSVVAQACADLGTCQNLMCRDCLLMSVSEGMKNHIFQVCVCWRHFSETFRRAHDDNLDKSNDNNHDGDGGGSGSGGGGGGGAGGDRKPGI